MSVLCISPDLTVSHVVDNAAACSSYGNFYLAQLASDFSQPTLQDIFVIPLASDLQSMWLAGFGTPVIAYLTAWGMGILINMFQSRNS